MDLSNIVFIENKPKKSIPKKKSSGNKKRDGGKTTKTGQAKTPVVKARTTLAKGHKAKRGQPQTRRQQRVERSPNDNSKLQTQTIKKKPETLECAKLPEKRWVKVPPKDGEPQSKKRNGKTYHWCSHCGYWGLHIPGKAKHCQKADPLAHLLSYFGGKRQSPGKPQNPPDCTEMDCDDISL